METIGFDMKHGSPVAPRVQGRSVKSSRADNFGTEVCDVGHPNQDLVLGFYMV